MRQLLKPARASQAAAAAGAASAAAAEVIAPPPEMNPAAAAFFDVDNTLMRGASIYHFARGLAARDMFTPLDLLKMTWVQVAYRLRGKEDSGHIDAVRQSALAFVADHKVADIVELGEQIYDETMARRIWQGTRDLALRHLAAGERVWLVTATPVELANILSSRLGLTGALGTVAEARDGVYTGALVGGLLHGEAKAAAVRALAAREGLDLCPLLGLQRLGQRPAHAPAGRPPARGQPGQQAARRGPAARLAGPRFPVRAAGHADRAAAGRRARRAGRRHRGRGWRSSAAGPASCACWLAQGRELRGVSSRQGRAGQARSEPPSRRPGPARPQACAVSAEWCPVSGRSARQ